MLVRKRIKTEEGSFVVEAEFSEKEMDLIVEAGLSYLLQTGALPFVTVEDGEEARFAQPTFIEQ